VSNQLLRTLDRDGGYDARTVSSEALERMRLHANEFRFLVELSMPEMIVPVSMLMNIKPDDILALPRRSDEPAIAHIGKTHVFTARPVRSGTHRAAQVVALCHESLPSRQSL
ncbi:MAG TPA: FliM/FliN family flagellar motor C-terminal domain-containing protein, partial [Terriglobales bacterium]